MTFYVRQLHARLLNPSALLISNVSLTLSLCRWWRQSQTSIVSLPHTTAPLPFTLWCFSAGRLIEETGQPLTPSCPPWIGSSGTLPPLRRSQLGETAENISQTAGDIQSVIFMDSHALIFDTYPLTEAALSHCSAPPLQTYHQWQQSVIGWRRWGWRDTRMSLIRRTWTH